MRADVFQNSRDDSGRIRRRTVYQRRTVSLYPDWDDQPGNRRSLGRRRHVKRLLRAGGRRQQEEEGQEAQEVRGSRTVGASAAER